MFTAINQFWKRVCLLALMLVLLLQSPLQASPLSAVAPGSQAFNEGVKQYIQEHPDVIIQSLEAYQRDREMLAYHRRQEALAMLQNQPHVVLGNSPVKGDTKGVKLIEFSDFQCPFCSRQEAVINQFLERHPEVGLVYKHLPLTSIHNQAEAAAQAAWAAGQQGKFWEYHDVLFQNQQQLDDAKFRQIAQLLNLDLAQFDKDRSSDDATVAVVTDTALAQELGIQGTPWMTMNGKVFSGLTGLEQLEAAYHGDQVVEGHTNSAIQKLANAAIAQQQGR